MHFHQTRSAYIILLVLVLCCWLSGSQDISHRKDPLPIIYPGQVNIALLSNLHESSSSNSSGACGRLREDAVEKAMAAVWAAHQVNFRKDDPQDLNIGVYIYDTCGREDIAQRQIYRLLGHVGHVQTTTCSEKRIPPLFAVMTEGDTESLQMPLKMLDSFGVPIITTSSHSDRDNYLSTAATNKALAKAAVTVLRQLQLLEVAVVAEDNSPSNLFAEFSKEAQVSGMQALPVDHPSIVGDPDNFLASLQVVSEKGRSRLKAVVFLVNHEQALDLLRSVDSSNFPQMPWVLVTDKDLAPFLLKSFKRHQLKRLQQVLLLSPEVTDMPEFQEYFHQLLLEDTVKYHPLLVEFVNTFGDKNETDDIAKEKEKRPPKRQQSQRNISNYTQLDDPPDSEISFGTTSETPSVEQSVSSRRSYGDADVSSVVKAVWSLAASLKTVQRRSCRRGTDCLLYLRRSLSSYVLKAAKTLDYTLDLNNGAASLHGTRLSYSEDGVMNSVRFSLKGFTFRGDIQEVGWYSNDEGLAVDHDVISPFNGFVFKEVDEGSQMPPSTSPEPHYVFHPVRVSTRNKSVSSMDANDSLNGVDNQSSATQEIDIEVPNAFPLKDKGSTHWQVFDDISGEHPSTSEPNISSSTTVHTDDSHLNSMDDNINHVYNEEVHVRPKTKINSSNIEDDYDMLLGPSYRSESHSASSNLRSVSLTSHHEPFASNSFRTSQQNARSGQLSSDYSSNSPALARSIDRLPARVPPSVSSEDVKVISSSQNLHIAAWLARPWALAILGLCGFGILVTMYVLVFLMVKACEGSLKKTNTSVAIAQLIAILCLYVAAALHTWKPSALQCGLKRLIPNISYAFCFGCLLLKGMYLKAQNSLGLGGSVNKCNQIMTLLFIIGVQVALEIQWWFVRPPIIMHDTLECSMTKEEIMQSQGYVSFLLLLSVILAVSTRKIPYNCQEVHSLIGTSLTCLVVFLAWNVACWLLPDSNSRNIAAPSALIITALVVLIGIFGPQLFAIHKYGGFPHKPLSYADSLSTVFTMFKDLDNASNSGTTGRGKKTAKTLETPFGNEVGESTRNPLYSDYQSAYP